MYSHICKSWCTDAQELIKCSQNQYNSTHTKSDTIARGVVMAEAEGTGRTKLRWTTVKKEQISSCITCGCTLTRPVKRENLHVVCIKMQLLMKSELFKDSDFFATDDSCISFSVTSFCRNKPQLLLMFWRQAPEVCDFYSIIMLCDLQIMKFSCIFKIHTAALKHWGISDESSLALHHSHSS